MAWIPAAHVAAEKRKRQEDEERELVQHLNDEQDRGEFEYKVLRSSLSAFRSDERMQRALEEEAQAGWGLLAKLDNERLLLRRPTSRRASDALLPPGVYPYRVFVDSNLPLMMVAAGVMILTLAILGVMIGLGVANAPVQDGGNAWGSAALVGGVLVLLLFVVVVVAAIRVRER